VATYLDSSAIVKLAVREPESNALRAYLRRRRSVVASALARADALRALLPGGEQAVARGRTVLRRLELVRVNDRVLNEAGILLPATLRTLDAIHLATALLFADDLDGLVTYDDRMAEAAAALGQHVIRPGP
jgi:uncharacterized protein